MRALLVLVGLALALVGCAAKRSAPEDAYYGGYAVEAEADYRSPVATRSGGAPMARREAAPGAPMMQAPEPADEAPQSPAPAQQRMVFYEGYAQMRATRPDALVAEVEALAKAAGGHVERRTRQDITVRVPVAAFLDFYDEVLALDEVLSKSLHARDITEAYAAVDLRLRTARATRERLQELLALAETEEEKLALLREIRRLTEQIDVAEAQLRTLAAMADFSRMTVQAVPRDAFASGGQDPMLDGMTWIAQLNPFTPAVTGEGRRLALPLPEGFVELDLKRRFEAESADGSTLHAARLDNEPRGSAEFWIDAIADALGPEFASAERGALGGFTTLRLEQPGADAPYAWIIGVRVEGRELHLIEIYHPGPDHEARHAPAIEAALGAGGQS